MDSKHVSLYALGIDAFLFRDKLEVFWLPCTKSKHSSTSTGSGELVTVNSLSALAPP